MLRPDVETAKLFSDRTRCRIVELLERRGEMTNTMIAKELGISKATVTHHMKILMGADVVRVSRVEESRGIPKKYYAINPRLLKPVEAQEHVKESIEMAFRGLVEKRRFRESLSDEVNLSFLRLLRGALLHADAELDGVLFNYGYEMGRKVLAEMVEGSSMAEVLASLQKVWKSLSLGRMEVAATRSGAEVLVEECYQCMHMPNVGRTLCTTDAGIIAGILEKKLGARFSVREVECWGTGSECCRFEIRRV